MRRVAFKPRTVIVSGRKTTWRLEPEFRRHLRLICGWHSWEQKDIIDAIHHRALQDNRPLSSSARLWILQYYIIRGDNWKRRAQGERVVEPKY
jgi:predicted DNA-binding ribbon-helix-helix protein